MKEETKMCKKVDAKGITLITLIITVIVMLILISITVRIALNGGIVSKTKIASSETQKTVDRDELQEKAIIEVHRGDGEVDLGRLEKELSEGWKVNKESGECVSPHGNAFLVEEDGSVEDVKWGMGDNGEITYEGKDTGIKVGDYVDYGTYVKASSVGTTEINGLYEDLKTYSGYTGTTYDTEYPITKEDLKWRVLDIKDGQIRLISDGPTTAKVYLRGYQGYNNAVYLIDEVCNTLYTTEKGTAQNLKIEDIEEKMNLDDANGGWDYHDYTNSYVDTGKYGGTKEYTSSSYRNYPAIFAQEKRAWVDDEEEKDLAEDDGLDLSEQAGPINQPAVKKANSKIKITQTYWYKSSMSESNWKNPTYQNIFIKDSSGSNYSTYWLTSRCVGAGSAYAGFYVRIVSSGNVNASYLYHSRDYNYGNSYCLRPVVSLKSDVQIGEKVGDTFKLN